jgi:hypothetical protein
MFAAATAPTSTTTTSIFNTTTACNKTNETKSYTKKELKCNNDNINNDDGSDPHILRVPKDCKTLKEAVEKANKSRARSFGTIHTISLSPGIHTIDMYTNVFDADLNYVEVEIPLLIHGHSDQISFKTIVDGGFLIKGNPDGEKGDKTVRFKDLTISNSADSGIYCFYGLGVKAIDVNIEDCEGRGMVVQGGGIKGEFSGTIQRCGMSGLSARDGGEIIVSCKGGSDLTTKITCFDENTGVVVNKSIIGCTCPLNIHANRTRIESNCVNGFSEDYGCETDGISSKIHFLDPLTKEHVSKRNSGGGNWGGPGIIDTIALKLRQDDRIYVPEEESTIIGAIKRAKMSGGHINTIVIKYGRYNTGNEKYINIDFSPLNIIGAGNDKTIIEGGGFKITGEKKRIFRGEVYVNKAITIQSLCISNAKGSGIFAENGLPCRVNDCTVIGSEGYGICCQLTWMNISDTIVESSGLSGIFCAYGGNIKVMNPRTRIWGNCVKNRRFDFGLRIHGKGSLITIIEPLMKGEIAKGNKGGGNMGKT